MSSLKTFGDLEEGDFFEYNGFTFEKISDSQGFNSKFGNHFIYDHEEVLLVSEIIGEDKPGMIDKIIAWFERVLA